MKANTYQPVIGLEVHVELKTNSKMFCSCKAEYFGAKPNTQTCPVCLGLPGALPVPNQKAIEWCVMIGQALNCEIPLFSKFDRKNYFYPDLAKGYQISQYDEPLCVNGLIHLAGVASQHLRGAHTVTSEVNVKNNKTIRIRRVHMEEDTAKLIYQFGTQSSNLKNKNGEGYSLIDFNRSGVPLVEIVTEPDFESAEEVVAYLKKLQQVVRYLNVSNADMEKGDMRLEPNISLRATRNMQHATSKTQYEGANVSRVTDAVLPPYKVEVKNINSFSFVSKAITYEIKRQAELLNKGETPAQETRGWDENRQKTVSQRSKEEAHDYRYFPEPDIPPIRWTENQLLELKAQLPELPDKKMERFKKEYSLPHYDVEILTRERTLADYYEETVELGKKHDITAKHIANWIINKKINIEEILPAKLIEDIKLASKVVQIDLQQLEKMVQLVLEQNPKAVADYKKGKTNALGFLVGMALRELGHQTNANKIKEYIERKLNNG